MHYSHGYHPDHALMLPDNMGLADTLHDDTAQYADQQDTALHLSECSKVLQSPPQAWATQESPVSQVYRQQALFRSPVPLL